jgi:hypothetical protein
MGINGGFFKGGESLPSDSLKNKNNSKKNLQMSIYSIYLCTVLVM